MIVRVHRKSSGTILKLDDSFNSLGTHFLISCIWQFILQTFSYCNKDFNKLLFFTWIPYCEPEWMREDEMRKVFEPNRETCIESLEKALK